MVVKINFLPLWHQQTSVPATRAQVTLSFDWLAFPVKLVWRPVTKFYRECQPIKWECYNFTANTSQSNERVVTCARVSKRTNQLGTHAQFSRYSCPPNKLYRKCQPIKRECYLSTRSGHGSLRVSQGKKLIFYHHGNWFLPPENFFLFFIFYFFPLKFIFLAL